MIIIEKIKCKKDDPLCKCIACGSFVPDAEVRELSLMGDSGGVKARLCKNCLKNLKRLTDNALEHFDD